MPIGHISSRAAEPTTGDLDPRRRQRALHDVGRRRARRARRRQGRRDPRLAGAAAGFDPEVAFAFHGEDEEQAEAKPSWPRPSRIALFLIAIILLLQFNSFYQAFLILSAVVFSTVGVFLGLLIVDQPFGIVMSGIGVIALAGIVVNNNIMLIDTYNELRHRAWSRSRRCSARVRSACGRCC